MSEQSTSKKGTTPPKGKPTPGRDEVRTERRVFGPAAQWLAVVFLIALVFVTVIVLFDGGDFNVFNDDPTR